MEGIGEVGIGGTSVAGVVEEDIWLRRRRLFSDRMLRMGTKGPTGTEPVCWTDLRRVPLARFEGGREVREALEVA